MDLKTERTVVAEVELALKDQPYTAIREIGLFRNSVLVLLARRDEDQLRHAAPPHYDAMAAYTLDRPTGKATQIWQGYDWRMIQTEQFEKESVTPDLLFTYESCMECEATKLITSFHFDPKVEGWRARWVNKEGYAGAPIDAEADPGADAEEDFAYAVSDLDGDGMTDIGVWTRVTYDDKKRPPKDYIDLYTVKSGTDRLREIKDKREQLRFKEAICNADGWPNRARRSPMCAPFVKKREAPRPR